MPIDVPLETRIFFLSLEKEQLEYELKNLYEQRDRLLKNIKSREERLHRVHNELKYLNEVKACGSVSLL